MTRRKGPLLRVLSAGLAFFLAFSGSAGAADVPAKPAPSGLSVDFVRRAQGVLSVRIPPGVKVAPAMDFAILDEGRKTVATIFPAEITPDRFWSGALDLEVIGLVKQGMAVERVQLAPEESSRVREAARARGAALQQEERQYRREELLGEIAKLESQIRSLRDDDARFEVSQQGIAVGRVQDVRTVFAGSNDLQTRIDADAMRQAELARQRSDLSDQVASLYTRPAPPRPDIDALTGQIKTLDSETDRINSEILRLQRDQRELVERTLDADEKRARSDLNREELRYRILKLEQELAALKAELARL